MLLRTILLTMLFCGAVVLSAVRADSASSGSTADSPEFAQPELERLSHLVRDIMLAAMPPEYENTKHWGRTRKMWDGLEVSLDGLQLKTKRRWKQANHGTWKKYQAWLIEPAEQLRVEVTELFQREDGRVEFVLTVRAPLGAFGRLAEWRHDVQLYSFSIQAEGYVVLRMRCDMAFAISLEHFPPDLLLDPVVSDAELRLVEFRIKRISDFSGPVVRELGDSLHRVLQDEIHQRRAEIVRKMNKEIDKHRPSMRVSVHELLRWEQVQELMRDQ